MPSTNRPPLTPLQQRYNDASTTPLPPDGLPGAECWCGGRYLDTDGGRDAHEIVFGHRPGDHINDVTDIDKEEE